MQSRKGRTEREREREREREKTFIKILRWWCTPLMPPLGRLRQADVKFQASLGYMMRSCLNSPSHHQKKFSGLRD
jgi:hypothetical protein